MNTHTGKAWHVIGYTWIGCAYCPDCLPEPHHPDHNGNTPQPVFVSDEFYLECPSTGEQRPYTCETCGTEIE